MASAPELHVEALTTVEHPPPPLPGAHTVCVLSGSARAGKTTVASSLAQVASASHGLRVTLVHADLGSRKATQVSKELMLERLEWLGEQTDLLVVDCGGEREAVAIAPSARTCVLVVATDARALRDAAARVRQLAPRGMRTVQVVVNCARSEQDGRRAFATLAADLDGVRCALSLLGVVPLDAHVGRAELDGTGLVELFPRASAALSLSKISGSVVDAMLDDVAVAVDQPAPLWSRVWRRLTAA